LVCGSWRGQRTMWNSLLIQLGFAHFAAARILGSLALTIVVELLVAALMGLRSPRDLATVALANILTNPLVVWVLLLVAVLMTGWGFVGSGESLSADFVFAAVLVALEVGAVFVEAWIIRRVTSRDWKRSLAVSAAMNAASLCAGYVLWSGLWWAVEYVTMATYPQA
jgi:hypothetical protein